MNYNTFIDIKTSYYNHKGDHHMDYCTIEGFTLFKKYVEKFTVQFGISGYVEYLDYRDTGDRYMAHLRNHLGFVPDDDIFSVDDFDRFTFVGFSIKAWALDFSETRVFNILMRSLVRTKFQHARLKFWFLSSNYPNAKTIKEKLQVSCLMEFGNISIPIIADKPALEVSVNEINMKKNITEVLDLIKNHYLTF